MSNVKVGDLAIITGGISTPENIGRIVTVLRHATSDDVSGVLDEQCWFVEGQDKLACEWECGRRGFVKQRVVKDAHLRPVSGLPDEQYTEEHNKLEA